MTVSRTRARAALGILGNKLAIDDDRVTSKKYQAAAERHARAEHSNVTSIRCEPDTTCESQPRRGLRKHDDTARDPLGTGFQESPEDGVELDELGALVCSSRQTANCVTVHLVEKHLQPDGVFAPPRATVFVLDVLENDGERPVTATSNAYRNRWACLSFSCDNVYAQ